MQDKHICVNNCSTEWQRHPSQFCIALVKGSNYPTWKLQCHMVPMREGLWSIASGTKQAPFNDEEENVTKFLLVEIEPRHSLYCPLSLHCCTYSVIRMTQLLSGRNCQISFKRRCGLIIWSYGKGCIVSS